MASPTAFSQPLATPDYKDVWLCSVSHGLARTYQFEG
jgi:hypothetical protein